MTNLRPQHTSKVGKAPQPAGLEVMRLAPEERQWFEAEALSIYGSMVNAGATLQQTLAAIYLSGMRAAQAALEDHEEIASTTVPSENQLHS